MNSDNWIASPKNEAFDIELAYWDCLASKAHVLMLCKQDIVSQEDGQKILEALDQIEEICLAGKFRYEPGYGAQLTLEKMVVDRVGPAVGYQMHTGRSRNDQVLTAQKLYVRKEVLVVMNNLLAVVEQLLDVAKRGIGVIMPGYTHMQPARPTTLAQWAGSYVDMFLRDLQRLKDTYKRNDTSPLGAAESHGTSWNLDRDYTRQVLGFSSVHEIPLDAISSRGESDADFLSGLSFIALHISKLAQDLLLFNTYEFGYVTLGSGQATRMGKLTGSSIMPQKRNPDVLELLRAWASEIYSYNLHALEVLKSLPSGYNRDSRDTKGPIINGLQSTTSSLQQTKYLVSGLIFHEDKMLRAAEENYSMAPDLAEFLAQKYHIPFREMHGIVGRMVAKTINEQKLISEISADDLAKEAKEAGYEAPITKSDIKAGTDVKKAIARRNNIGGASRERMESWLEERNIELKDNASWILKKEGVVSSISEKINNAINNDDS